MEQKGESCRANNTSIYAGSIDIRTYVKYRKVNRARHTPTARSSSAAGNDIVPFEKYTRDGNGSRINARQRTANVRHLLSDICPHLMGGTKGVLEKLFIVLQIIRSIRQRKKSKGDQTAS